MRLRGDITINGRLHKKGSELAWYSIYPFFLLHMLIFGASGFFMAYGGNDVPTSFLYMHGGIAILVYTIFYLVIFGWDEVKWMFINAAIGVYGLWCEIGWLLGLFGKKISDFPWERHVIPFTYYVLYTFLLRHLVLEVFNPGEDPAKKRRVEIGYIVVSVLFYTIVYLRSRG